MFNRIKTVLKCFYGCWFLSGGEQDYVEWLAHSDEGEKETDGCVLGYKETFQRLKSMSVCRKGRNYVVSKEQRPCPCSREDYMW